MTELEVGVSGAVSILVVVIVFPSALRVRTCRVLNVMSPLGAGWVVSVTSATPSQRVLLVPSVPLRFA